MSFDPNPLQVLVNAGAGTSAEFPLNAFDRVALDVEFKTGVTAGVVVLEVAPYSGFSGTWATVLTATFAGAAPNINHQQADITARVGRVRVSTALTGGVCDAYVDRRIIGKGNS